MTGERAVFTRQVEGGGWQAHYEDGEPNQFGAGETKEEAIANLKHQTLQGVADLGRTGSPPAGTVGGQAAGPTVNEAIAVKTNRIVTKKLPHPVEINGKVVSYAAYRESDPGVQSYGTDEQSARVQFLTDEQGRGGK